MHRKLSWLFAMQSSRELYRDQGYLPLEDQYQQQPDMAIPADCVKILWGLFSLAESVMVLIVIARWFAINIKLVLVLSRFMQQAGEAIKMVKSTQHLRCLMMSSQLL